MVSHLDAVQLRISSHMHIACVKLGVYLGFMKKNLSLDSDGCCCVRYAVWWGYLTQIISGFRGCL